MCFTPIVLLLMLGFRLFSARSIRSLKLTSVHQDFENALKDANKCIQIKPDWGKVMHSEKMVEFQNLLLESRDMAGKAPHIMVLEI